MRVKPAVWKIPVYIEGIYFMYNNNRNGSRVAWARGFMALCAMLAMGLGLTASPAEAAPFAYVVNQRSNNVSVIDTATNMVVATVPVGAVPGWVAVTPDGKYAYVTNGNAGNPPSTVSVIDTATNMVVATVPVGLGPGALAVTPDGKHVYVTIIYVTDTSVQGAVSMIDTATNTGSPRSSRWVRCLVSYLRSPSTRTGNTSMSRLVGSKAPALLR